MPSWKDKDPCVYILASRHDGVLYTGVTTFLFERVSEHKQDLFEGFTKKYGVHTLVYYEFHETMDFAIIRETRIKKWKRAWKVRLIHSMNREWIDLFDGDNGAIKISPVDSLRRSD
jgi:putative endonuclease